MNQGSNNQVPLEEQEITHQEYLEVYGARVHNLKNIDVIIPRDKLVVVTGLSGSGKSSLAFDTIYAEGQRRYMETFSAYARQFMGDIERPDVDKITGLSPVISIEQKTTNRNPRSTVGTITEIYDFLRLLYARAGEAFSFVSGQKMVRYTDTQIIDLILENYSEKTIYILAPLVRGRKGHYRELFEQIRKQGFLKVRVDGEVSEITFGMQVDRYKIHDIEAVIDTIKVNEKSLTRLTASIQTALRQGKSALMAMEVTAKEARFYSRLLMDPETGIAYDEPEPNSFSYNSPYGYCPRCKGLGYISEIDLVKVIPDTSKSIRKGGIAPVGEYKPTWIFRQLEAISHKYHFTLDTPLSDIPDEAIETILYGSEEVIKVKNDYLGVTSSYSLNFEGIVQHILNQNEAGNPEGLKRWAEGFMNSVECPDCNGSRLKKESLFYKINDKNIAELSKMDLVNLSEWFDNLEPHLEERQKLIAHEIIREIQSRLSFLLNVGLDYLSLNRTSGSLSGGESQRIRLATQIGSQLVGVLYILDEPSIGLHQRDNHRLIASLKNLRDTGNSVIVVEHDQDMILAADHVIDMGPGAGTHGGHIVAQGSPETLLKLNSVTCQYLSGRKKIALPLKRRKLENGFLTLTGATGNNLKNVDLKLPLGVFTCITGVSGSGKSSL
ncbi:MAG: excinuclease ABC subunit UvrA, partial [Bacteroidales bacterium]|nr:excinuclease ABC subunit UvrA [Bacteroidales bacterium]